MLRIVKERSSLTSRAMLHLDCGEELVGEVVEFAFVFAVRVFQAIISHQCRYGDEESDDGGGEGHGES